MLILFHGRTSVASAKVRLALAEKGIGFESRVFDLRAGAHRTPEYLAINPAGVVPTLAHEGRILRESGVILEYIDETWPEPPLMPPTPFGRAQVRLSLRAADQLHDACSILSSCVKLQKLRRASAAEIDAALSRVANPQKRSRQRRLIQSGFAAPDVQTAVSQYQAFIDDAASALAHSDWLSGSRVGLADCAALPYLRRGDTLGMAGLWAGKPALIAWLTRMRERPSYKAAILDWADASDPYETSPELRALVAACGARTP